MVPCLPSPRLSISLAVVLCWLSCAWGGLALSGAALRAVEEFLVVPCRSHLKTTRCQR